MSNLRRWVGPIPPEEPQAAQSAAEGVADIEVGDIVMARDAAEATKVDLAEVTAVTDAGLTLECNETRNATLAKAKFRKVFTKGSDVYLGKPTNVTFTRWTW